MGSVRQRARYVVSFSIPYRAECLSSVRERARYAVSFSTPNRAESLGSGRERARYAVSLGWHPAAGQRDFFLQVSK